MQKAEMGIKKYLVVVFVVLLLFTLSSHAVSENKTAVFPVIQQTYKTDDLPDKDQLAEDFISNLMSGRPSGAKKDSRRGASLSGTEGNLYSLLLNDITSIANGERSSTILEYDASAVYPKTVYTKDDLGVDAILDENMQFTQAAVEALDKIIGFNLDSVISSLLYTCPYELYWYDKTKGVSVDFPDRISANQNAVYIEGTVTFWLCVCEEYRLNGEMYSFDTTFGAGAVAAAAKAGEIVATYNGYSDEGILRGYASEICDLVSYNFDALDDGTPYGNPWQLVWVFDENPATNVVCEGYSKAFQYLCNRTSFSGNIHVITVTGTMDGGTGAGRHMWNVVKLNDGYNYLVDVTNIDEDTIGYPDQLLLVIFSSGNYTEGYTFITSGGTVSYEYDAATLSQYSKDELALEKAHHLVHHEGKEATCTEIGWYEYDTCEDEGCDYSTYEEIPALGHTLTAHPKVDSTCAATGTEAYWSCDVCEKLFSDEEAQNEIEAPIVIGKKAHTLTAHSKVDSTCTATGTEAYWSCVVCEKLFSDEEATNEIEAPVVIAKKAHTLTAHAKVDSTCTATGTEAYWSCDVCKKLFSDEEAQNEIEAPIVIAKKAHTLTAHAKVDSTCTETGTEAYWSCDICEKLFSDEEAQNEIESPVVIEKKAHTLTAHAKVDSTCTATGTEAYWSCDVCKKLFSDEEAQNEIEAPIVIAKKAHTLTAHAKVDSTCTETGTEAYWSCDICEKLFSDEEAQNEIESPVVIEKKAHTLTAHAKVVSTCTATGTEAYWSCDVCEKLFSDEEAQNEIEAPIIIEKKAHTLTAHAKVDSTCTATGTEAYWECGICHKLFSDEEAQNEINAPVVIEKKAHALTAHPKVDSTCTATGTEAYWECSICHNLFSDEEGRIGIDEPVVIAAKGHDWNETVYEWSADNTSITATYTCIYDESHSETETVSVTSEIVSPGETTEGSVIYTSGEFTKEGFSVQTKEFIIPALGNMSVLRLPGMLDTIEDDAFSGLACQAVIIPDVCTSIGENAFAGCTDLLYVRIPSSVTSWPSSAFTGCNENLVIDWIGK